MVSAVAEDYYFCSLLLLDALYSRRIAKVRLKHFQASAATPLLPPFIRLKAYLREWVRWIWGKEVVKEEDND